MNHKEHKRKKMALMPMHNTQLRFIPMYLCYCNALASVPPLPRVNSFRTMSILFICLPIYLSPCMSVYLSIQSPNNPSVRPTMCLLYQPTCLGFLPARLPGLFFVFSLVTQCVYLYICLFVSSFLSVLKEQE